MQACGTASRVVWLRKNVKAEAVHPVIRAELMGESYSEEPHLTKAVIRDFEWIFLHLAPYLRCAKMIRQESSSEISHFLTASSRQRILVPPRLTATVDLSNPTHLAANSRISYCQTPRVLLDMLR